MILIEYCSEYVEEIVDESEAHAVVLVQAQLMDVL